MQYAVKIYKKKKKKKREKLKKKRISITLSQIFVSKKVLAAERENIKKRNKTIKYYNNLIAPNMVESKTLPLFFKTSCCSWFDGCCIVGCHFAQQSVQVAW